MNAAYLGKLAGLTLRDPAEAARHLMARNPGRDVLWMVFFLTIILATMVQLTSDTLVPVDDPAMQTLVLSAPQYLATAAAALMLSIATFFYVGRFLGGDASFDDIMILVIWLQLLQVAAQLLSLLIMIIAPDLAFPLVLATILLSLYITAHFLDQAHRFGSLGRSVLVMFLSGVVAVPFVLALSLIGPV